MASDSGPASSESEPLLPGRRAPSTGGWKSALFIIWVEVVERFAYYGILSNLISYLTGSLGQNTTAAAAAVNAWSGAAAMLPLLGATVADSWLGRYRTIVASSVLYITGLGMLTLSSPQQCRDSADGQGVCPPSSLQTAFFYVSLYLVAIAQSGHKPCVQAFGADQFDATDPDESVSRASFERSEAQDRRNTVTLAWDNIGWALGFGVPSMAMLLALVIFLLGTRTYRFYDGGASASTFSLVRKAFVAWRKRPR
ncbi:unnamed protein product [Miscanthus lutarioriparius]|uniref:Uncharacterized protein n=1 Tax=Miscanthus lutarioriparius TaxID=422564 RepID=A0A811RQN5_9POAL|nr:unnamed protein product [Miscanthus lutarioriparius]